MPNSVPQRNILSLVDRQCPEGFSAPFVIQQGAVIPALKTGSRAVFVERGVLRVAVRNKASGDALIGYRSSGWIVGDIFPGEDHHPTLVATALTTCQVRGAPPEEARAGSAEREALLAHLAAMYAAETEAAVRRDQDLHVRPPMDRFAILLLEFGAKCGRVVEGRIHFECPLRQVEISHYLGLSPEHVNRMLHRMHQLHLLGETKWPELHLDVGGLLALIRDGSGTALDEI